MVLGLSDTNGAQSGPFLAIFGPFLGHIVELEGKKGLFVMEQSRISWSVATVSLRCSVLTGLWGSFGPRKAVLGHKMRSFGGHLPTWRLCPGASPVSFWLKTRIWQGHHLGSRIPRVE